MSHVLPAVDGIHAVSFSIIFVFFLIVFITFIQLRISVEK